LRTESVTAKGELLWLLSALTALAPLAVDAYLPALPAISRALHADSSGTQLTLTACLVGLAGGQLVAGPVSDVRGRRRPLLAGLVVFVVASLACAAAPSLPLLVASRLIQGGAAATAIVIARAVVADLYAGDARARAYSRILTVGGVVPVAAPIAGGQLLRVASWRGIFVVIGAVGALLAFVVAGKLAKSIPVESRRPAQRLRATLGDYRGLLRDRTFVGYSMVQGCVFAAMFAYIAAAPFVIQKRYGLSAQAFSIVFAANAFGIVATATVGRSLAGRTSSRRLVAAGLASLGAGAAGLAVAGATSASRLVVLPSLWLIVASVGLILPHATTLALASCSTADMGSASALIGAFQFVLGAAAAPAVGVMGPRSVVPLAIVVTVLTLAALAASLLQPDRRRVPLPNPTI
jgi:DHA1 family bicyclomycin/chloramphenicol resistance-like MFS transporter